MGGALARCRGIFWSSIRRSGRRCCTAWRRSARVRILRLLHNRRRGVNVNDIAEALGLPQSTVSSNLQILEGPGSIRAETQKGRKGRQKLCFSAFDEVLVMFRDDSSAANADAIEVAMPIGLYTRCEVSAPCGLCSPQGIIGLLDVPGTFLDPTG